MKAPDFSYVRPIDLGEAMAELAKAGDGGHILAGGQSLMPMLNFRAVEPDVLIDINRVDGLSDIDDQADFQRHLMEFFGISVDISPIWTDIEEAHDRFFNEP